ncbi:hypothetical protein ACJMK2_012307 [Sinanodonta woodiana]|uniref:C2H2-type domain-containing protein n=1 Tax=Sinanodonta woodiana TaxID=1069815 RepID=A0ABD3VA28_SINWO
MSETAQYMYQCGHCDYKATVTPSLVLHNYLNHPGKQFQRICLPPAVSPEPQEDPPVSPVRQDESKEQVETIADIVMDKNDPSGEENSVGKDQPVMCKNTKKKQVGRKKKKSVKTFFHTERLSIKKKKKLRSEGSDRSKNFQCGWCKFSANLPMFILAHHKSRHPSRELDIIMLEPSDKWKNEFTLSSSEEKENCPVFDNCPDVENESFNKCKGYVLKLSTHSCQIQFHCAYCSYTGHLRHQVKLHCRKAHPNKTFLLIEPGSSGGTSSDCSNAKFYNEEVVDAIALEADQYAAKHVPDTAARHVPDTAARHVPDTAARHVHDSAARHVHDSAARHVPDTAARHVHDSAARHELCNVAGHELDSAAGHEVNVTRHKPDSSARHNVDNSARRELNSAARHELSNATRHKTDNSARHKVDNAARHELDNGSYSVGYKKFKLTPVAVKCIDIVKSGWMCLQEIINSNEINCINIDSLEAEHVIDLILKGREEYSFYMKEAFRDSVCLNVLTPQEIKNVIMR